MYAAFLEAEGAPEDPGEWGVALGAAEAYLKAHEVYERVFEHGLSLANPSDHLECVVLPHAYRDLDGVEHTSICLPPHSGDVLSTPRTDRRADVPTMQSAQAPAPGRMPATESCDTVAHRHRHAPNPGGSGL